MNHELEMMKKEVVMAYIAAVFRHSSCGSGDSHKNVQGSRDSNWISPRRRYKYCHLIQHTLWI
jgi:hypothetical protein